MEKQIQKNAVEDVRWNSVNEIWKNSVYDHPVTSFNLDEFFPGEICVIRKGEQAMDELGVDELGENIELHGFYASGCFEHLVDST